MKNLFLLFIICSLQLQAQNIDDNFITFPYTQVPLIPIEQGSRFVRFSVEQGVDKANQDSTTNYHIKTANAERLYEQRMSIWYGKMSLLQQQENTSGVSQTASYPIKPYLKHVPSPIMNSISVENLSSTLEGISIPGFQKADGGLLVTFKIMPLRDFRISHKKSGTGAQTKYAYSCTYYLAAKLEVYGPDGTIMFERLVGNTKRTKVLGKYKSKYAFSDWFMKNRSNVYSQSENQGRIAAIQSASKVLESQFGFVNKSRRAEVYSIKKYKDYDYSDVASAYNKTNEALLLVGGSPDRSNAYETLKEARNMWSVILEESNIQNRKERINGKVSAIIWCNIAEISMWMGDFNNVDIHVQNIRNSGVFKAKNHINGETSFYKDQRTRWEANFE